jgi:hypothetical protein
MKITAQSPNAGDYFVKAKNGRALPYVQSFDTDTCVMEFYKKSSLTDNIILDEEMKPKLFKEVLERGYLEFEGKKVI